MLPRQSVCVLLALAGATTALFVDSKAHAGGCTPSTGPDVIVGDIPDWSKWGTVGGITAYSVGTTSCNIGDAVVQWTANNNQHPVIAQNAYRLKGGRFEQIGMCWVKHGWGALTNNFCCTCINPQNFEQLGVGCSDPYDSGLNGDQDGIISGGVTVSGLGPRSEVNAANGYFPYPYTTEGMSGNAIYKRLQIHNSDLDPALNAGALYFAEAHYVAPSDAAAGNGNNNASYRQCFVGAFSGGGWTLNFTVPAATKQQKPGIIAWKDNDTGVNLSNLDVPGDGRFTIAYKCSSNGNGTWHYEYALYNMNSDRSGQSFSVPIPTGVNVTNAGFHDVDYHSGDGVVIGTNYDGTDWPASVAGGAITWATDTFALNPNANALRWATLYNFRFDADAPPRTGAATVGLFKPGSPGSASIATCIPRKPGDVNNDGVTNTADLLAVINAWGPCPATCLADVAPPGGDGVVNAADLLAVINNWGP